MQGKRLQFVLPTADVHPNCILCLELDHREDDCGLAKAKLASAPSTKQPSSRESYWDGSSTLSKGKALRSMMCFSWNQSERVYP